MIRAQNDQDHSIRWATTVQYADRTVPSIGGRPDPDPIAKIDMRQFDIMLQSMGPIDWAEQIAEWSTPPTKVDADTGAGLVLAGV
jgi:hypothetical protein